MEKVNKEQFNEIVENNQIVLVDFYADWCGPCKMLAPILNEVETMYPTVKIIKVNVDEETEIAEQFKVMSVPTVVLFYNGKLKQTITGFQPKSRWILLLDPII